MSAPTVSTPADKLTTQEKLLLSQAVYKFGAVAWPIVSKALLNHPVCQGRPVELFTPEQCEASYVALMASVEQNVPAPDGIKPQAKSHLRLAQTFYLARLAELKTSIEVHEASFVKLMGEINAIKSGQLDSTIQEELRGILARKYGKKKLDSWFPPADAVKAAAEMGPDPATENPEVKEDVGAGDETQKPVDDDVEMTSVEAKADVEETAEVVTQNHEATEARNGPDEASQAAEEPRTESQPENEKEVPTTPKDMISPASDLSPPPSVPPSAPSRDKVNTTTSVIPPSPTPTPAEGSTTRSSKRKASAQPRNAPASKRSGRRGPAESPAPTITASEAASEDHVPSEEIPADPADDEDLLSPHDTTSDRRSRSTRRASKRGGGVDSPRGSSPSTSKRGASVGSAASTPAGDEKRSSRRRGMRDEVVSKSVRDQRDQSAAVESVKEEDAEPEGGVEENEEQEPERESAAPTSRRSTRGKPTSSTATGKTDKDDAESTKGDENVDDDEQEAPETETKPASRTRRGKVASPSVEEKEEESKRVKQSKKSNLRGSATQTDDEKPDVEAASADGNALSPAPSTRAGPRHSKSRDVPKDIKATQKLIFSLLDTISSHRDGNVFQNPVKESVAPDYYEIIKQPMDLKKIRQRIRDGHISSIDEFERDILLMFSNAMMYNGEGSQVYEMAQEMLKESENHIAHYRSMQHDMRR